MVRDLPALPDSLDALGNDAGQADPSQDESGKPRTIVPTTKLACQTVKRLLASRTVLMQIVVAREIVLLSSKIMRHVMCIALIASFVACGELPMAAKPSGRHLSESAPNFAHADLVAQSSALAAADPLLRA